MPKATLIIGGPLTPSMLDELLDALADANLPVFDYEGGTDLEDFPSTDSREEMRSYYRNHIETHQRHDELFTIGAWENTHVIETEASRVVCFGEAHGLDMRISQPNAYDPALAGEIGDYVAIWRPGEKRHRIDTCEDGDVRDARVVRSFGAVELDTPEAFAALYERIRDDYQLLTRWYPSVLKIL